MAVLARSCHTRNIQSYSWETPPARAVFLFCHKRLSCSPANLYLPDFHQGRGSLPGMDKSKS